MVTSDQMVVLLDYEHEGESMSMLGASSFSWAPPQQWNSLQADIQHHNIADSF